MPTLDLTNRQSPEERRKLPKPTNAGLLELFLGVTKVVIKDNGVIDDKAISEKVLLTISKEDKLKEFSSLLEIDDNNTGFYCLCLGTYAIELFTGNQIKATIGFHHGVSIRYYKWNGDAALSKSDNLLTFLAEQGLTKPLDDRINEKRNMEADRVAERKWLEYAPTCFNKYWTEINNMDNQYFGSLISDLNIEIPDKNERIIVLLQTFGRTENFWTAYPVYEELPNNILQTFDIPDIISAYLRSDRNYKTRKGLGRFLCSFEVKKVRKEYLEYITTELIDDLEKCFVNLGEQRGINEIFNLREEKTTASRVTQGSFAPTSSQKRT